MLDPGGIVVVGILIGEPSVKNGTVIIIIGVRTADLGRTTQITARNTMKILRKDVAEREVLYFENFNLENIKTPVNAEKFDELLSQINYDENKRKFLYDGFKNGFDLGYCATDKVQVNSKNLKLRVGDEIDLWNKVMKEVKLGRYAGSFSKIPNQYRDDYIESPIGLVPKDDGKD